MSIPMSTGTPLTADFAHWTMPEEEFIRKFNEALDLSRLDYVTFDMEGVKLAGTETVIWVGKSAGIETNTLLPISEWLKRLKPLSQSFEDFKTNTKLDMPSRFLRNYASTLILFNLLSRLPETAYLQAFEHRQDSKCPTAAIEPTWSIGAFAEEVLGTSISGRTHNEKNDERLAAKRKRLKELEGP